MFWQYIQQMIIVVYLQEVEFLFCIFCFLSSVGRGKKHDILLMGHHCHPLETKFSKVVGGEQESVTLKLMRVTRKQMQWVLSILLK